MNATELQPNFTDDFCFPEINNSCRRFITDDPAYIVLYVFLSLLSLCTVFLNLLVIISISHFKQLHTPTNLLIMSLAVADLLVGLFAMPIKIMKLVNNCWYLGKILCSLYPVINYVVVSASLGSLVFIAYDRYIAINNPLLYSTRMTVRKTSLCIFMTWLCAILYNTLFFYFDGHLLNPDRLSMCVGECVVLQSQAASMADLVITFIGPCFVILFLYLRICKVALHQAKSIKAMESKNAQRPGVRGPPKNKATKTLSIVIFMYLACWIPFLLNSVSVGSLIYMPVIMTVFNWLLFVNSSVNPLIYAIFYPWFRTTTKHIVTCKIFQDSSSTFNVFPDHF